MVAVGGRIKATYKGGLPAGRAGQQVDVTVEPRAMRITGDGVDEQLLYSEIVALRAEPANAPEWGVEIEYERNGFRSSLRLGTASRVDAVAVEYALRRGMEARQGQIERVGAVSFQAFRAVVYAAGGLIAVAAVVVAGLIMASSLTGSRLTKTATTSAPQARPTAATSASTLPVRATPAEQAGGSASGAMAVQEYESTVNREAEAMSSSTRDFARLAQAPEMTSVIWRGEVEGDVAVWQLTYNEARGLQPPPCLQSANTQWVSALALDNQAASDTISGLNGMNAFLLNRATSEINEAADLVEQATLAMSEATCP
jgi:hypothetical protein